jgi:hypothetical protein
MNTPIFNDLIAWHLFLAGRRRVTESRTLHRYVQTFSQTLSAHHSLILFSGKFVYFIRQEDYYFSRTIGFQWRWNTNNYYRWSGANERRLKICRKPNCFKMIQFYVVLTSKLSMITRNSPAIGLGKNRIKKTDTLSSLIQNENLDVLERTFDTPRYYRRLSAEGGKYIRARRVLHISDSHAFCLSWGLVLSAN